MTSSSDNSSPWDQKKAIQKELMRGKEVVALLGSQLQVPELIDPLVEQLKVTFDRLHNLVDSPNYAVVGSPSSGHEVKRENFVVGGSSRKRIPPSPLNQLISKTTNDGYKWRKYGQKRINGFKHPRSYFYCYHKDQGCRAGRQVQITNEDSTMFVITYINKHICKQVAHHSTSLKEESTFSFGSTAYNNITQVYPPQLSSSFPSEFTSRTSMLSPHTNWGFASDNGDHFNVETYQGWNSVVQNMGSVSDSEKAVPAGLNSSFGSMDSFIGSDQLDYTDELGELPKDYDEAAIFNFDEGDFSHQQFTDWRGD